MDKEMLDRLDNIADNFDYLIELLENNKQEKQAGLKTDTSLNFLSSEFESFGNYLKSIDSNIKDNTTKLNAYLDNVATTPETDIDNPEFALFNENISNLIIKLDELKNNLIQLESNLNINVNTEQIEEIKEKLSSGLILNIDVPTIDAEIEEINAKLESLNNVSIQIDFKKSFDELGILTEQLENLKNIKLDNLDLSVTGAENIQKIIDGLESLKDLQNIDFDNQKLINGLDTLKNYQDLNFDNLKKSLDDIKTIDLSTLDISKLKEVYELNKEAVSELKLGEEILKNLNQPIDVDIDTEKIVSAINNVKKEFDTLKNIPIDVDLNIDYNTVLDDMQSKITKITDDIKNSLTIQPELTFKTDKESIDKIKEEIGSITIDIDPDFHLIESIQTELDDAIFDINVNPVVQENNFNPTLETQNFNSELRIIKEETDDSNETLIATLEDNNRLLSSILMLMSKQQEDAKESAQTTVKQEAPKEGAVATVAPENQKMLKPEEMNAQIIDILKQINSNISSIGGETKPYFMSGEPEI